MLHIVHNQRLSYLFFVYHNQRTSGTVLHIEHKRIIMDCCFLTLVLFPKLSLVKSCPLFLIQLLTTIIPPLVFHIPVSRYLSRLIQTA